MGKMVLVSSSSTWLLILGCTFKHDILSIFLICFGLPDVLLNKTEQMKNQMKFKSVKRQNVTNVKETVKPELPYV
jgi:hypothetical protein